MAAYRSATFWRKKKFYRNDASGRAKIFPLYCSADSRYAYIETICNILFSKREEGFPMKKWLLTGDNLFCYRENSFSAFFKNLYQHHGSFQLFFE